MSIAINQTKCIGCKKCTRVCPGSLIQMNESGKAQILYPRECWGCTSCIKECGQEAIDFFLGADIGGRGSSLTVKQTEDITLWNITKQNGERSVIEINRKDSNQY